MSVGKHDMSTSRVFYFLASGPFRVPTWSSLITYLGSLQVIKPSCAPCCRPRFISACEMDSSEFQEPWSTD
jgi:hypothetical protein